MIVKTRKQLWAPSNRKMKPVVYLLIASMCILIFHEPVILFAQQSGNYYLLRGMRKYNDEWDIAGAIIDLQRALSTGLSNNQDKIQAYKYLAFCHAENGEKSKAVQDFKNLLLIAPSFRLDADSSPTHLVPFNEALGSRDYTINDMEPPVLINMTQSLAFSGSRFQIRVKVTDNIDVARVTIAYKTYGMAEFVRADMAKVENDIYQFEIREARKPRISYAIAAWDKAGNRGHLTSVRGSTQIVEVTEIANLAGTKSTPGKAKESGGNTLLWVILGGAAVAGGIIYFTKSSNGNGQDNEPTTGTISITIPGDIQE